MSESRKAVQQYNRSDCYFCGSEGPIETHHIHPKRHGGSDLKDNLVDLCPTCHERLERLYTDTVWEKAGVEIGTESANVGSGEQVAVTPEKMSILEEQIDEYQNVGEDGAPIWLLHWKLYGSNFTHKEFLATLETLKGRGEVYLSSVGYVLTT